MFEERGSLERRRRKGQALERRGSVGCRRGVLYLYMALLVRDGVTLVIDR